MPIKKKIKSVLKKVTSPKFTKKGTLVTLVLDETGSMSICKKDTIGGYNEYIKSLQKEGKDILFSMTKFDSTHVTKVHDAVEIKKVPSLNEDTYRPGASTPLFDAIAKTINSTEEKGRNVLCVILTDGEENSSHEYNKESVKKLIEEKTKAGWTFVYLGANQDAWATGGSLGILKSNIKNYDVSKTKGVFSALGVATNSYSMRGMSCGYATSNFLEQDENDPNIKLK